MRKENKEEIERILSEGKPVSVDQVSEDMELRKGDVRSHFTRLARADMVERGTDNGKDVYTVTEKFRRTRE
jgi:predicted ArsR family transcriptional regulator